MSDVQTNWLLCGRIGSGKSAVRSLLESHGVDTIDADSVGHEVLRPDGPAAQEVAAMWPDVVVAGAIDRGKLGSLVFADPSALRRLEAITHPHIFSLIGRRVMSMSPPVVVEIPLLGHPFSGEWRRVVVDASEELMVERAVARGMERGEVLRRMAIQPSRQEWLSVADLVIPNYGDRGDLEATTSAAVGVIRETPKIQS